MPFQARKGVAHSEDSRRFHAHTSHRRISQQRALSAQWWTKFFFVQALGFHHWESQSLLLEWTWAPMCNPTLWCSSMETILYSCRKIGVKWNSWAMLFCQSYSTIVWNGGKPYPACRPLCPEPHGAPNEWEQKIELAQKSLKTPRRKVWNTSSLYKLSGLVRSYGTDINTGGLSCRQGRWLHIVVNQTGFPARSSAGRPGLPAKHMWQHSTSALGDFISYPRTKWQIAENHFRSPLLPTTARCHCCPLYRIPVWNASWKCCAIHSKTLPVKCLKCFHNVAGKTNNSQCCR